MTDAFKIFLWSVSAYNDARIMDVCKPKIVKESPYLIIDVGKGIL